MSDVVTEVDGPLAELDVTCGPLVAGGDALVRQTGEKTLFVEGGLPNERVTVALTQDRKDLRRGHVTKVVTASSERIEPPCPMFSAGCGGCQWQHIEPSAQHQHKLGIVIDSLTRIAKLPEAPVRFGGAVPDFGYRTTMNLAVVDGRAALRKRHTKDPIALDLCMISHPLLEELIKEGRFGDATEVTLRVSVATGERLAWVRGDVDGVKLPNDVQVTPNGRNASVHEDVLGHRFRVSARSFFQSGPAAAELVARYVSEAVPEDAGWIVDAYAGVGLFSLIVGDERDGQITVIEQERSAVHDARHNLSALAAEVIEAEVALVALPGETSPDVVIADPSRTGLGKSASKALTNLDAETFVLVSCDPASLARDVKLLDEQGYQLNDVVVLDIFPQTHHVETVSTFTSR